MRHLSITALQYTSPRSPHPHSRHPVYTNININSARRPSYATSPVRLPSTPQRGSVLDTERNFGKGAEPRAWWTPFAPTRGISAPSPLLNSTHTIGDSYTHATCTTQGGTFEGTLVALATGASTSPFTCSSACQRLPSESRDNPAKASLKDHLYRLHRRRRPIQIFPPLVHFWAHLPTPCPVRTPLSSLEHTLN